MKRLKELVEQRGTLNTELKTLQDTLEKESRAMTEGEKTRFNEITADLDKVNDEIKVLEDLDKRNKEAVKPVSHSVSNSETREIQKNFSFLRAINGAKTGKLEGFEKEMHEEAEREYRQSGLSLSGVGIPTIALNATKRDMTVTGGSPAGVEGGYAVQTNVGGLITALSPKLVLSQLGVTTFDNLIGSLDLLIS